MTWRIENSNRKFSKLTPFLNRSKLKYYRTIRIHCNSSMILAENYTCKLKLQSRYISYITLSIQARKKVFQLSANLEMSHKLLTDQNYRSLVRIPKLDVCKFVEKVSDIPELALVQSDLEHLFGSMTVLQCPIQQVNLKCGDKF